jgi:ABC-2 type transport system ATP-binding protein
MRDLLRGFADGGGTVLLSSHLLHEIEVIADDIVVIGNGRIVAQGTKEELLAAGGTLVRAADQAGLVAALQAAGLKARPGAAGVVLAEADLTTVGAAAFAAGIPLTELRAADGAGLEEMFLALTAESQRDHLSAEGAAA